MNAASVSDRHLLAILVADLVGYSTLMANNETAALQVLHRLRHQILEPRILAAGGQVIKRMGDGWLAGFPSVMAAATCALAVQRDLQGDPDIALRIGIHLGEVVETDDDFFGDGINVATRLETLADPGGVVLSGDAHKQIASGFPDALHSGGQRSLKNIPDPVEIWSWPDPLRDQPSASGKSTLHIAPFEGAPEAGDLSDDLAATLDRQTGVDLVSNHDQARYCLTGTLRSTENHCRLSVQLTDQENSLVLWRGRLEERGDDLFDRLDRLVVRTVAEFRYKLQAYEARVLTDRDLSQMSVADLLNAASGLFQKPDEVSWRGVAVPLRLALEKDPGNFMAQAMLAASLLTGLSVGWKQDPPEVLDEARRLSASALSSAPNSDFTVFSRGYVLFKSGEIDEARRLGERALEINQGYANSYFLVGMAAAMAEDGQTARDCADKALETDIQHPMRHLYELVSGYAAFVADDLALATGAFRRATVLAPDSGQAALGLMFALELAGETEAAAQAAARLADVFPDFDPAEAAIMPFRDAQRRTEIRDSIRSAWARSKAADRG